MAHVVSPDSPCSCTPSSLLPRSRVSESLLPADDQRRMREWEKTLESHVDISATYKDLWTWYRALPKRIRRSWTAFSRLVLAGGYTAHLALSRTSYGPRDLSGLKGERPFAGVRRRARRLMHPGRSDQRLRHAPPPIPKPVPISLIMESLPPEPANSAPISVDTYEVDRRQSQSATSLIGVGCGFNLLPDDSLPNPERSAVNDFIATLPQTDRKLLLKLHNLLFPDNLRQCELAPHPVVSTWLCGWFRLFGVEDMLREACGVS